MSPIDRPTLRDGPVHRGWVGGLPDVDGGARPRGARVVAHAYVVVAGLLVVYALRATAHETAFATTFSLYAVALAAGAASLRSRPYRPVAFVALLPLLVHAAAGLAGAFALVTTPDVGAGAGWRSRAVTASLFAVVGGPLAGVVLAFVARRTALLFAALAAGTLLVLPLAWPFAG